MNILSSPCLETDPPATIVNQLHDIYPPETVPLKAHFGTKGILKFYHAGQTEHILSETGTHQGDP